ncbi:MAG: hypothetical protein PVF73_05050 [Bacteroidales bacterium]|jgi:hypothetical protein
MKQFFMADHYWILALLTVEFIIFFGEIIFASFNKKNKAFKKDPDPEHSGFVDLKKGFRTTVSIARFSLFIAYILLVFLYIDISRGKNIAEEIILYLLGGILVYMVSLMNARIFVFYTTCFVVSSPFNFFKRDMMIHYDSIVDYRIYKALYNAFYLKLTITDSKKPVYIHFYGSYLPKNDLALRYILDMKVKTKKGKSMGKT